MLIWLLPIFTVAGLVPGPEGDFVPLFNGKDLSGWRVSGGKAEVWRVENGMLVANGSGGGWLLTEKEYRDFILDLEFRLPEMGNSGVALRTPAKGNPAYDGLEIQILDDRNYLDESKFKGLKPTQRTGAIYDVVPPTRDATRPAGEWNHMRITAQGPLIRVELNGVLIVEANLANYRHRVAKGADNPGSAHPGLLRPAGHLGLQSHDGRVEFRNVRIKELGAD